jgi:hypothetical protein
MTRDGDNRENEATSKKKKMKITEAVTVTSNEGGQDQDAPLSENRKGKRERD